MNYKIKGAIRRNRTNFIIFGILWVFFTIVFVSPFAYSKVLASAGGTFDLQIFIDTIFACATSPLETIANLIQTEDGLKTFVKTLVGFTFIYGVFFFIGFVRSAPKNEFSDIEHGSSDWSQRGEQYRILSNKKGIILAENHYLPTDKIGNVNVLVVGRIW